MSRRIKYANESIKAEVIPDFLPPPEQLMNTLTGKIALVTGASRGIGASVARMLASRGADDSAAVPLPEAQRAELKRRIEEDDAHPDDLALWEQVKASTLSRLGK